MALASRASHEIGRGLGPAGHVQFLEDIRQVILDSLITQPQSRSNLFISLPLGDERQDALFLGRQLGAE